VANVNAGDVQQWGAAAMSESGTCYWIREVAASDGAGPVIDPGTYYGSTTTAANCTGAQALTATQGAW
jgi:hypothetical protein